MSQICKNPWYQVCIFPEGVSASYVVVFHHWFNDEEPPSISAELLREVCEPEFGFLTQKGGVAPTPGGSEP